MSLYNEWLPAEATIEVAGELRNIRAPSKAGLVGGLGHLANDGTALFMGRANLVKPIKYVVDVGANIGATTLLFYSAFPDARLLAIEPIVVNYDCLLHNIKGLPGIMPLKMAAYDRAGSITMAMPTHRQRSDLDQKFGNSGLYSIFGEDHEHSETVDADLLDNIVAGKVDLLKIDVEGAEFHVLRGARRIVTEDRPILMVEHRGSAKEMAKTSNALARDWFKDIGYKLSGKYMGDYVLCPVELDDTEWISSK